MNSCSEGTGERVAGGAEGGVGWNPALKLWEIQMSMSTYWNCANVTTAK